MDMKTSVKAKLAAAGKKFDITARKTAASLEGLSYPLRATKLYTQIYHAQNVSSVHLKLRQLSGLVPEFLKPKATDKAINFTAKFVGKYLGCTMALVTYKLAVKAVGMDPVKDFASTHLLGFLSVNAPVPNAISGFLAFTGLAPYAPAIATTIAVVALMGAFRIYTGLSAHKANQFAENKRELEQQIQDICLKDGFGPSPKLDKLVKAYGKSFKPDFTPQQTQAIRDSLAAQRSELGIYESASPTQQEAINKIQDTLTKQYAVPAHLALNAGLHILVAMDGNTHAVMAKLKSHNIEEDWINKYKINPDATVLGVQRKIVRQDDQALEA